MLRLLLEFYFWIVQWHYRYSGLNFSLLDDKLFIHVCTFDYLTNFYVIIGNQIKRHYQNSKKEIACNKNIMQNRTEKRKKVQTIRSTIIYYDINFGFLKRHKMLRYVKIRISILLNWSPHPPLEKEILSLTIVLMELHRVFFLLIGWNSVQKWYFYVKACLMHTEYNMNLCYVSTYHTMHSLAAIYAVYLWLQEIQDSEPVREKVRRMEKEVKS